jgi:hypothetical protein
MGLMSGSACWLMSRATSHAAAAGLRLSGERRVKPGHVSAPDPCLFQGPPRPRTLLRSGPRSGERRTHPGDSACLPGSSGLVPHRGPVFLSGGLDPVVLPGMYYPSSPRGALRPAHVVGSGVTPRVTWRSSTCAASSYRSRGYP